MNVTTIEMPQATARKMFLEYKQSVATRHDEELEQIMKGYRELVRGRRVLSIVDVMREAGLREDNYPRLAICKADEWKCKVEMYDEGSATFIGLKDEGWRDHRSTKRRVHVPRNTFQMVGSRRRWNAETMVPLVPPQYRPKAHLRNFHILWEVEEWKPVPPRDPFLLKRIGGDLFAVVAAWELTDLERAVLGGRR